MRSLAIDFPFLRVFTAFLISSLLNGSSYKFLLNVFGLFKVLIILVNLFDIEAWKLLLGILSECLLIFSKKSINHSLHESLFCLSMTKMFLDHYPC